MPLFSLDRRDSGGIRCASRCVAALVLAVFLVEGAAAQALPQPTGPAVLTLSGKLGLANRNGDAVFDEEMLMSLPRHRIATSTPWTEGTRHFEGVLLSDLLRRVGALGTGTIAASAINDYRVEFPASDADEFGVLLAMHMDGTRLTRRDRGPIWIVYPRDSIRELRDERYDHRWVWQLDRIEIR